MSVPWVVLLRAQLPFLGVVAVCAVGRFLWPTAGATGAIATWALILGLWLLGGVAAGLSRRVPTPMIAGALGIQNVAIQLLVVVPSIVLGLARLGRDASSSDGVFLSNALVTLVALPLLSAVVLTVAGLAVAMPLRRLRSDAAPTRARMGS